MARGKADAWACQRRFELPDSAKAMRPDGLAGCWFDRLIEARAEALGADWLPGMASNLKGRFAAEMLEAERVSLTLFLGLSGRLPAITDDPGLNGLEEILTPLRPHIRDPQAFAELARMLCMTLAEPLAQAIDTEISAGKGSPSVLQLDDKTSPPKVSQTDDDDTTATSRGETATGDAVPDLPPALAWDYRIFSREHDRLLSPEDLAGSVALLQWRAALDQRVSSYQHWVARLAHRLQRQILERQRRNWAFDQESGVIDGRRLTRLACRTDQPSIFKLESESPFRKTAVTLLLDNSGSMRGHSIEITAMTADILARTFERCGIKVEILGYTTAPSRNNPVTQAWIDAGQPSGVGRINALRLMVYKAMDQPWRRARMGLGLMLDEALLQENIDGEALAFAAQRLLMRPEPRKMLIVISDGAPMEPDTLIANSRDYLERHLHQVVAWIQNKTAIELHAIGIGHDVTRFYPSSALVREVDQLGPVLIDKLSRWLD
jgi:cobaltochelatase CobT